MSEREWTILKILAYLFNAFATLVDGKLDDSEIKEMAFLLIGWTDGEESDLNLVVQTVIEARDELSEDIKGSSDDNDLVNGTLSYCLDGIKAIFEEREYKAILTDMVSIGLADGNYDESEQGWVKMVADNLGVEIIPNIVAKAEFARSTYKYREFSNEDMDRLLDRTYDGSTSREDNTSSSVDDSSEQEWTIIHDIGVFYIFFGNLAEVPMDVPEQDFIDTMLPRWNFGIDGINYGFNNGNPSDLNKTMSDIFIYLYGEDGKEDPSDKVGKSHKNLVMYFKDGKGNEGSGSFTLINLQTFLNTLYNLCQAGMSAISSAQKDQLTVCCKHWQSVSGYAETILEKLDGKTLGRSGNLPIGAMIETTEFDAEGRPVEDNIPPAFFTFDEFADFLLVISLVRASQQREAIMNHTRIFWGETIQSAKGLIKLMGIKDADDIQIDKMHNRSKKWCNAIKDDMSDEQIFHPFVFGDNDDTIDGTMNPNQEKEGIWHLTCKKIESGIELHAFDITGDSKTYFCPETANELAEKISIDEHWVDGSFPADQDKRNEIIKITRAIFNDGYWDSAKEADVPTENESSDDDSLDEDESTEEQWTIIHDLGVFYMYFANLSDHPDGDLKKDELDYILKVYPKWAFNFDNVKYGFGNKNPSNLQETWDFIFSKMYDNGDPMPSVNQSHKNLIDYINKGLFTVRNLDTFLQTLYDLCMADNIMTEGQKHQLTYYCEFFKSGSEYANTALAMMNPEILKEQLDDIFDAIEFDTEGRPIEKNNDSDDKDIRKEKPSSRKKKIKSQQKKKLTVQGQLADEILKLHPNAFVKKVDDGNYLDIHMPDIHSKKGTHIWFNTPKAGGIKIGFFCRDKEFIEQILNINAESIEAYANGLRLLGHPTFKNVDDAIKVSNNFLKLLKA